MLTIHFLSFLYSYDQTIGNELLLFLVMPELCAVYFRETPTFLLITAKGCKSTHRVIPKTYGSCGKIACFQLRPVVQSSTMLVTYFRTDKLGNIFRNSKLGNLHQSPSLYSKTEIAIARFLRAQFN